MIQKMNVRPFGRTVPTGKLGPSLELRMGALDSQMGKYRMTHYTLLGRVGEGVANPQKSADLEHMAIHITAAKALRVAPPVYSRPIEMPYFNSLEYIGVSASCAGGRS